MPCKCDPARSSRGECSCKNSPVLPGGSPQRILNKKRCPKNANCGSGAQMNSTYKPNSSGTVRVDHFFPDWSTISNINQEQVSQSSIYGPANRKPCTSLEPRKKAPCSKILEPTQSILSCPAAESESPATPPPCMREDVPVRKPLKKRPARSQNQCKPARLVEGACGTSSAAQQKTSGGLPAKIFALEKTLSKTQWQDEDGYHSASVTMSQLYRPDDQVGPSVKSCASEKRRNYLRAKLRELLGESKPIPEGDIPDGGDVKPEPEVVAAALLASDGESTDLGKVRPDNVFDQLFSSSSPDRAVALASAAPEPMNSIVVPLTLQGSKPPSLDVPNVDVIIQQTRGLASPNPSAFQESANFGSYAEHRDNILSRTPTTANVSRYVGATTTDNASPTNHDAATAEKWEEGIFEYIIKPQAPFYRNRMQLNGSVQPSWFPGFVVVSPVLPDFVRLTSDAGKALRDAWCLCRPQHVDDRFKSLVNIS